MRVSDVRTAIGSRRSLRRYLRRYLKYDWTSSWGLLIDDRAPSAAVVSHHPTAPT
jgi:hypothetical protein